MTGLALALIALVAVLVIIHAVFRRPDAGGLPSAEG